MIAAVIVIILIICILSMPLRAELSFRGKEFLVRIFLFGIPVMILKPKGEKRKTEKKSPEKEAESFRKKTMSLRERIARFTDVCKTTVRLLHRYATVEKINLKINVGTGDAAITAISTGALWAAVYSLLGIVGSIVYIKKHEVEITPCYQQSIFETEGKCIFKSRPVHIIIIALTILRKINHLKGKEE